MDQGSGLANLVETPTAKAVLFVTIAVVASLVAVYLLLKWRGRNNEGYSDHDHLSEFRELHHRGMISESEFRIIKVQLGKKIRGDMDSGGTSGESG